MTANHRQPVWARYVDTYAGSPGIALLLHHSVQSEGLFYYMEIHLSIRQLELIIQQAAEMGAILALSKTGKIKPYLKKSDAFRLYKRRNVERWIVEGLITPRKDGEHSACWRIDRMEIDAIEKAELLLQSL